MRQNCQADDLTGFVEVCGYEEVGWAGQSEESLQGVTGDGGVGGVFQLEGALREDGHELVNGAGASEGAGVAIGEVMADASEGFIEIVFVEGFTFFVEVGGPEGVEIVHVFHGTGCYAGVVDVDMSNDESVWGLLVEDAGVVDALCHALL